MREQENTWWGVSVRWRAAVKLGVAQLKGAAVKLGVAQLKGAAVKLSVAQWKRVAMQDLIISLPKKTYCFEMWMNST